MFARRALLAAAAAALVLPASASALTVSKAQLTNGQLRIEGTGAAPAGSVVIAESESSAASARIDVKNGGFKIEASGFTANTCVVTVRDGSTATATPRLTGCTPAPVTPPPANPPGPSGSCVINPSAARTFNLGDLVAFPFTTTGCSPFVQWKTIAGQVPPGMGSPITQGQTDGEVEGRPIQQGTFTFTVQVTDGLGQTDAENFTATIAAPRPVTITTGQPQNANLNRSYDVLLQSDGGLPSYAYSLAAGTLPPGISIFSVSGGHIAGTPTRTGTYTFTVRATDSLGNSGTKTFTITVI